MPPPLMLFRYDAERHAATPRHALITLPCAMPAFSPPPLVTPALMFYAAFIFDFRHFAIIFAAAFATCH